MKKYLSFQIKKSPTGIIGLVPADDYTQSRLFFMHENSEDKIDLLEPKSQRDVVKHRQGFAILNTVLDNLDDKYLSLIINEDISQFEPDIKLEKLRKALLIATGFSETETVKLGTQVLAITTAKSMSFEKMTEDEFSLFRTSVKTYLSDFIKELNIGWDDNDIDTLFKNF